MTLTTIQSNTTDRPQKLIINEPGVQASKASVRVIAIATLNDTAKFLDICLINNGKPLGDRVRNLVGQALPNWDLGQWVPAGDEF